MKEIYLTQGKVALVDDEDFERVSLLKWHAWNDKKRGGGYYALSSIERGGKRISLRLHRFVLRVSSGLEVDHRDGNGLNNQKANLRSCVHAQNSFNHKKRSDNTSGYKGVSWSKKYNQWEAYLQVDRLRKSLGFFDDPKEAHEAYKKSAFELHGEFACVSR